MEKQFLILLTLFSGLISMCAASGVGSIGAQPNQHAEASLSGNTGHGNKKSMKSSSGSSEDASSQRSSYSVLSPTQKKGHQVKPVSPYLSSNRQEFAYLLNRFLCEKVMPRVWNKRFIIRRYRDSDWSISLSAALNDPAINVIWEPISRETVENANGFGTKMVFFNAILEQIHEANHWAGGSFTLPANTGAILNYKATLGSSSALQNSFEMPKDFELEATKKAMTAARQILADKLLTEQTGYRFRNFAFDHSDSALDYVFEAKCQEFESGQVSEESVPSLSNE